MTGPGTTGYEETDRDAGRDPAPRSGNASLLPTAGDQPTMPTAESGVTAPRPMSPGDVGPEGTPGTGENLCPHCDGSGHDSEGKPCPVCDGTGKVITGIGGA